MAFWSGFTIDCMAIGGFFAVLLYQKNLLLKLFLNNWIFTFSLMAIVALWLKVIFIPYINPIIYSGLYGVIILNLAANKQIYINLEFPVFNYLGNISYGLYMLHPIGIVLALKIALSLNFSSNLAIYPIAIIFTIILASISYRWYESYFLTFKSKFAVVKSGSQELL